MQAGPASSEPLPPTATERLIKEIGEHSQAMQNLEELCDGIGGRMTGSQQLRTAQGWAMQKLTAYGGVNVHEEAYDLGRPWKRGIARARLLNANEGGLDILQKAWTAGTSGPIQGDVALLDVKTLDEFKAAAPGLRGKIVLVISAPTADEAQRKNPALFHAEVNKIVSDAHFGAVLLVSRKDGNLHEMWGGPRSRFDSNAGIITRQGASLLTRLLARGVVARLEIELGGGFGKDAVQAYNVVADFTGSEAPDEMVIIGAHQDSWDLGAGATDNGAGTVAAMEILRAMHAQGLKPKRTLRIVLFSGEEQGLLGSMAYVARHRSELSKVQAVFVQDAGAGRIVGFPDMKVEAWYARCRRRWRRPRRSARSIFRTASAGVPITMCSSNRAYRRSLPCKSCSITGATPSIASSNNELDSIDYVAASDLVQGAQVMAVAAWGMLNGERLPHQKALPKP